MSPKELTSALVAGLLSSGVFFLVFAIGLGFPFMFLPTLPLLTLGLSGRRRVASAALLCAALLIGTVLSASAGLVYAILLASPACYLANQSLRWRERDGKPEWMPIGLILANLTAFACGVLALIGLYYATSGGSLPAVLAQNIREAFSDMEADYGEVIDMLADRWSFLVFAVTIWMWGLTLYAHGWLAHRALKRRHVLTRPSFAIEPFTMPVWMLGLLGIAGLASLVGSESMSFLGKAALVALMLPYFFSGAQLMHAASHGWPNRQLLLFFIYFMIVSQFWPALAVSITGLWHQLKNLNKYLSGSGTSSKS